MCIRDSPFIARYRKEAHGGMDDTRLRRLQTRLDYLRSLQARRIELRALISAQTELTEELYAAIEHAETCLLYKSLTVRRTSPHHCT